jgi:hypothetical protein
VDFKEFSFAGDIRVCVYNVGNENLSFHRHTHIADITYCAAGRLLLELPESGQSCLFYPGQIVQVPADTVHRVSHCGDGGHHSRYILIQLGRFSIDFERDVRMAPGGQRVDLGDVQLPFHLGDRLAQLRHIAAAMREHRPADVSDSEYADLLAALDFACEHGLAGRDLSPPIAQQLRALAATEHTIDRTIP